MKPPTVRYPVRPLLEFAAARQHVPVCPQPTRACVGCSRGAHYWYGALARDLGIHPSTPHHWQARGGLIESAADLYATRLGEHPSSIWPEWWDNAPVYDDLDLDLDLEGAAA